jgi:RNA polymerase sigma-70 factor, ECF subfamily
MTPADPYVLQQASCRASLLVATARFTPDDWGDLRQELVLDCLRRSPKFDPTRGDWHGFVRGVMRNHATVLAVRKRRRCQREFLAGDLLQNQPGTGDAPITTFEESLMCNFDQALQTSIDLERVLGKVPAPLRILAFLLSEMSVKEISKRTGKSRSRVYQMTVQLREACLRAGLTPRGRTRIAKSRADGRSG